MKIETTKERILEAAQGCSDAKRVLKTLFPEVFEDDKYFDLTKLKRVPFEEEEAIAAGFHGRYLIEVRKAGKYSNKAFYLNSYYAWEIVIDEEDVPCLVPTKKN